MNNRRFLRVGILLVAALELVPRGIFGVPLGPYWLVAYGISLTFTLAL